MGRIPELRIAGGRLGGKCGAHLLQSHGDWFGWAVSASRDSAGGPRGAVAAVATGRQMRAGKAYDGDP